MQSLINFSEALAQLGKHLQWEKHSVNISLLYLQIKVCTEKNWVAYSQAIAKLTWKGSETCFNSSWRIASKWSQTKKYRSVEPLLCKVNGLTFCQMLGANVELFLQGVQILLESFDRLEPAKITKEVGPRQNLQRWLCQGIKPILLNVSNTIHWPMKIWTLRHGLIGHAVHIVLLKVMDKWSKFRRLRKHAVTKLGHHSLGTDRLEKGFPHERIRGLILRCHFWQHLPIKLVYIIYDIRCQVHTICEIS